MTVTELNTPPERTTRQPAIDVVRGLVMVIMALDHTREFWGATPVRPEDIAATTPALFFTRWITHFCAPAFVLLSGVSLFLFSRKAGLRKTSHFAVTRGAWLLVVEIVLMSFILTHSYDLIVLSILWVIGWSMIGMAGLIFLPRWAIVATAAMLIGFHDLLPFLNPQTPSEYFLASLHNTPFFIVPLGTLVTYTLVPWIGVMAAGYVIGAEVATPAGPSRRILIYGLALMALFVALRLINVYGDPVPYAVQDRGAVYTLLSFLNVSKYPASLQFLSLTIGATLVALSLIRRENAVTRALTVFGRVPFFFFVLHFLLISLSSRIWTMFTFDKGLNLAFTPFAELPSEYEPSLLRVYLVWATVVFVTWWPCRWYGALKARSGSRWLSYV